MLSKITRLLSSTKTTEQQKLKSGEYIAKSAHELLSDKYRSQLLERIKQTISLPEEHWNALYQPLFEKAAVYLQALPASEYHHHACSYGMLDHSIETALFAALLRRNYTLPANGVAEEIGRLEQVYSYAIISAALIHDIGKIIVDQLITIHPGNQRWQFFSGPLKIGSVYSTQFNAQRIYELHAGLAITAISALVPSAALDWLSKYPDIYAQWLFCLGNHSENGAEIDEIVRKADQYSVSKNLGATGDIVNSASNKKPLHEKLLTSLRLLLSNGELPLNRKGAAGWLTEDALWMVSKRMADALRSQLTKEGHSDIPSDNTRIFDALQERQIIEANTDKAIWQITINDNQGWEQSLSVLKFPIKKIYGNTTPPPPFDGNITLPDLNESQSNVVIATPQAASIITPIEPITASTIEPIISDTVIIQPATEGEGEGDATTEIPEKISFNTLLGELTRKAGSTTNTNQSTEKIPDSALNQAQATITPQTTPNNGNIDLSSIPDKPGKAFMQWLSSGISNKSIKINEANAKVHTVADGLFIVTPGIFQRYIQERPEETKELIENNPAKKDFEAIQIAFQELRIHQRTDSGLNIFKCEVQKAGAGRKAGSHLNGYFINNPSKIGIQISSNNINLKLKN